MEKDVIKVLVVDDSKISRELLTHLIESDPKLKVIGIAENGNIALEFLKREIPDIITMDIVMPLMDGFESTKKILEIYSIPIVVVSGIYNAADVHNSFKAIEAGAIAILEKPRGIANPEDTALVKMLIDTLKAMTDVKAIKKTPLLLNKEREAKNKAAIDRCLKEFKTLEQQFPEISMIGIGTSLGGPQALQTILTGLPRHFPVPIAIVQHIAPGFIEGFVGWLNSSSQLRVKMAENGEEAIAGTVYMAPDQTHLEIGRGNRIRLIDAPPEEGYRPSVARLFRSMAQALGSRGVGVLLTGMGKDGAKDLLAMRNTGAITIVQDKESSLMFGMPGEAIRLGASRFVLPLQAIPGALMRITHPLSKIRSKL